MRGLAGPPGRLRTTYAILRKPFESYTKWRATYGDTFLIKALNGDVVVSCDPAFVRDFLKLTDDEHVPFATDAVGDVLGRGTMLVSGGDAHRQKRKVVGPFFRGERMRAYAGIVGDITREQIAGWTGELVVMDEMLKISLGVIIGAVFGADEDAEIARYRVEIDDMVRRLSPFFLFTRHAQRRFFGLGPWARYQEARGRLLDHLVADLELRRSEGQTGRADILSCLAEATYSSGDAIPLDDAASELTGLLFAGHETTQIALAWAVYWLHTYPETLERLRAELDAADREPAARLKLPYLEAVVYETLRLYPIVPDVLRTLTVDKRLGELDLPVGSHVAVAAAMTHMREDLYPEPEIFRPERFLGKRPAPASFLAFGAGVRRCIGAALALFEMKLVLAEVVSSVDLELLGEEVPVRRNATTAPKNGVRVRVVRHRDRAPEGE